MNDLGLSNFEDVKFTKAGSMYPVVLGSHKTECLVQCEKVIEKVSGVEDSENEGQSLIGESREMLLGYKVSITPYDKGLHFGDDAQRVTSRSIISDSGER